MSDFHFLKNASTNSWVISAPRRAKRPNASKGTGASVCPFCPGLETEDGEVYRIEKSEINAPKHHTNDQNVSGLEFSDSNLVKDANWLVRVIPNKFPFAPIHELVIHSPDHHKSFDELPFSHVERILQTYRQRFQTHREKGQVIIFHNHGAKGGESVPHPHTQIAVIPKEVTVATPQLLHEAVGNAKATDHFLLFCPANAQWSDEVWIAPKWQGRTFGDVSDDELNDLAFVLPRLIKIMDLRHGSEFPYNFYIYPGKNWYLRLIPREKTLGGFEVATNIFVNTQDPHETQEFINLHFDSPDEAVIREHHQAEYHRGV